MDKIILRALTSEDISKTLIWHNLKEIQELYLNHPFPVNLEMEKNWYEKILTSNFPTTVFGIEQIENQLLVGITLLRHINLIHRTAEFAIFIGDKDSNGKGIGKEATSKTLAFGFDQLGLNRIDLKVRANNSHALNLYKSIGFIIEGKLRESIFKNGLFVDEYFMSILKNDFEQKKHLKENIIIIGAGQHCNVVLYNLQAQGLYNPCCILDSNKTLWGTTVDNVYIEPDYQDFDKEYLKKIAKKHNTNTFFIGLGSMKLRKKLYDFFISQKWHSVNIIHPTATVSSTANLGKGILIEADCIITPSPIIGNNVVVNTGSQVNHDNIVEDHVYIASGVILSGGVTIGENTLLDDGVIITLSKKVGKNCIVGAGSVVTKDIPDNTISYGSPAKVIRTNDFL